MSSLSLKSEKWVKASMNLLIRCWGCLSLFECLRCHCLCFSVWHDKNRCSFLIFNFKLNLIKYFNKTIKWSAYIILIFNLQSLFCFHCHVACLYDLFTLLESIQVYSSIHENSASFYFPYFKNNWYTKMKILSH